MSCLAIIGSAGRGQDASLLTEAHWRMMCIIGQTVACTLGATRLVSGGSAWADAVAIQLYLDGHVEGLTLHLPCAFQMDQNDATWHFDRDTQEGRRLNQLHSAFSGVTDTDPWCDIARAISKGAETTVSRGFHARNRLVAKDAGALLAFTFGEVRGESGTGYTWRHFLARPRADSGEPTARGRQDAFHFDLTTRVLTRHAA